MNKVFNLRQTVIIQSLWLFRVSHYLNGQLCLVARLLCQILNDGINKANFCLFQIKQISLTEVKKPFLSYNIFAYCQLYLTCIDILFTVEIEVYGFFRAVTLKNPLDRGKQLSLVSL